MLEIQGAINLDDAGTWKMLGTLITIVGATYVAALWMGLVVWTWRDIRERTDDPVLKGISVGTVAMFFLPGWLVYFLLRPSQTLEEERFERLEADMLGELRAQPACPQCARRVADDFTTCPYCTAVLRSPCRSCGKPNALSWEACPYCSAARAPVRDGLKQPLPLATPARLARGA